MHPKLFSWFQGRCELVWVGGMQQQAGDVLVGSGQYHVHGVAMVAMYGPSRMTPACTPLQYRCVGTDCFGLRVVLSYPGRRGVGLSGSGVGPASHHADAASALQRFCGEPSTQSSVV